MKSKGKETQWEGTNDDMKGRKCNEKEKQWD